MGRKRFAKKSEEVRTFRLVARSQNDDHFDEEGSTPLVLEPFVTPNVAKRAIKNDEDLIGIPESLQKLGPAVFAPEGRDVFPEPGPKPRAVAEKAEGSEGEGEDEDELAHLEEDCYFPKDGYNYDQHLKRVSGVGKGGGVGGVVLEVPVKLAAEVGLPDEKEISMQPAFTTEEAELLRALDFADEYEEMDEDFGEEILTSGIAVDDTALVWGPNAAEDKHLPDLAAFKAMHTARLGLGGSKEGGEVDEEEEEEEENEDEDGVPRRRQPAAPSDEDFRAFLLDEYGDDEIGACEEEEIAGPVTFADCEEVLDEYIQGREDERQKLLSIYEPKEGKLDDVPRVIDETKALIAKYYDNQESSEEEVEHVSDDEDRLWDCETVLSTLSNVSNRPGKIGRIKVVGKPKGGGLQAVKEEGEDAAKPGKADSESDEDDVVELPDVVTTRERGETTEERRARKAGVKEMRRICRKMKKESKDTFKTEAAKLPANKGGSSDLRQKTRHFKL